MPDCPQMPLGPLMIDVVGTTLDERDRARLCHPAVGGVILFSRNYETREQVAALCSEIKALRAPGLLIAVDQEGGRVQRFQNEFVRLPAMAKLGQRYAENRDQALQLAENAGFVMATELIDIGVDFSFAPVLDLAAVPSAVIGDRSFDTAPEVITELAAAVINGMNAAGMQATGKHFPGHGNVSADSHHETPVDPRSFEQIQNLDLQPFTQLQDQLGAVMTAHIHFPKADAELPTYSKFWIEEVLRRQIGFEGVVFSDDLSMKGALAAGSISRRVQKARAAGCDMALICNDPDAVGEALKQIDPITTPDTQHRLLAMRAVKAARVLASQPEWGVMTSELEALA